MINGRKNTKLPEGWDFRFEATKAGYGEKFYTREAAVRLHIPTKAGVDNFEDLI